MNIVLTNARTLSKISRTHAYKSIEWDETVAKLHRSKASYEDICFAETMQILHEEKYRFYTKILGEHRRKTLLKHFVRDMIKDYNNYLEEKIDNLEFNMTQNDNIPTQSQRDKLKQYKEMLMDISDIEYRRLGNIDFGKDASLEDDEIMEITKIGQSEFVLTEQGHK